MPMQRPDQARPQVRSLAQIHADDADYQRGYANQSRVNPAYTSAMLAGTLALYALTPTRSPYNAGVWHAANDELAARQRAAETRAAELEPEDDAGT